MNLFLASSSFEISAVVVSMATAAILPDKLHFLPVYCRIL